MEKITYASLGSLGEPFHREFESALDRLRLKLGGEHPLWIDGKPRRSRHGTFQDVCPANRKIILGRFQKGSREDTRKAILGAKKAFPSWRAIGWRERIALLRKAAQIMAERQYDLAVLLSLEVGKNRFEAIAEVSESVDLILYYCRQMEDHSGFEIVLQKSGAEQTRSVLKPYGVWAVISPFNFPLALAAGMCAGALIGGNTVVFKPASDTPWSGLCLSEILHDAGLPPGVFQFITGPGGTVGGELLKNSGIDGLIFTGSHSVGMHLRKGFQGRYPRPCMVEMGGKNAALVMPSADLDDASEGILRSGFGMGGQKCSACSRVYVHRDVQKAFMERLLAKTCKVKIGDPLARETFLGPLINIQAVQKYTRAIRLGRREGRIVYGGGVLDKDEFKSGWYVEPAIVDQLPRDSRMFQDEFFAPILAVAVVKNMDDALSLANWSNYGLTAGIFTQDDNERRRFFDQIEAGVVYSNRRGGATTGAWPGVQSFGGWKGSGSSGKNALGPHYVAQFMREQSQTITG